MTPWHVLGVLAEILSATVPLMSYHSLYARGSFFRCSICLDIRTRTPGHDCHAGGGPANRRG